jgi:hypothetical protein
LFNHSWFGPRGGIRLVPAQLVSLRDVDVEIAVFVVVEQRHTGPHDLAEKELAAHPVDLHEVEPGLHGDLDERILDGGGDRRGRRRGRLGRRGAPGATPDRHGRQERGAAAPKEDHRDDFQIRRARS